jgi:hypothetical protein
VLSKEAMTMGLRRAEQTMLAALLCHCHHFDRLLIGYSWSASQSNSVLNATWAKHSACSSEKKMHAEPNLDVGLGPF